MDRGLNPITTSARRGGVTLFELVVSMTVAAILTTLAVTSIESSESDHLAAAARTLADDLRLARGLAIEHGAAVTLSVDTAKNDYELTAPPAVPLPRSPSPAAGDGYRVDVADLISPRVRVELTLGMTSGTSVRTVTFHDDGRVAVGGGGPGAEDAVLWVRGDAEVGWRFLRLRLSATTGTVRIEGPWPGGEDFRDRLLEDTDAPPAP